jgi:hypothetical protein
MIHSLFQIQLEACRQELAEKAGLLLEASAALETLETRIRETEAAAGPRQQPSPRVLDSPAANFQLGLPPWKSSGSSSIQQPPPHSPAEHRRPPVNSPLANRKGVFFPEDLANNNNNVSKEADRLLMAVLEESGTYIKYKFLFRRGHESEM